MTLKPFSETISTGSNFFDPGDIIEFPSTKIEAPVQAKPTSPYTGPIKKPSEVTAADLKKAKTYVDKVNLYIQMVGATHLRKDWIHSEKNRLWDDVKKTQYQGWGSGKYNQNLLNFLRKQDSRWLKWDITRKKGITHQSVTQGLMRDLGISKSEAGMKIAQLTKPEWAKKLSKKDLESLKRHKAGEFLRSLDTIPVVKGFREIGEFQETKGFRERTGEYYHRDVGWY